MVTRWMIRFSAVAVVGLACAIASEANAQLFSALEPPTTCFSDGPVRIDAGLGQSPFPEDVTCPGGAGGTCSKYNYRFSSTEGGNIRAFLSVSADLNIYEVTPAATIEDPSCGSIPPTVRPGNRICEQRTIRWSPTASTLNASVIVKKSVPRVATAGVRRGGGCGEDDECWSPPIGQVCLIQGPGAPAAKFETFSSSRIDRVANNQCDAKVTLGPDGGVTDAAPPPPEQGCGYNPDANVTINGQQRKNTTKLEPDTFGSGTTTCYRTSAGKSICYCKNPSSPCPN